MYSENEVEEPRIMILQFNEKSHGMLKKPRKVSGEDICKAETFFW